jgi:DNA-binding transcriptional LysR family regulator
MSDIDVNNIRRLDGGLLVVFRGLLRRRRTTDVARELGLSQSAVSHALTRLRDLFDDPLFVRRSHGLEPTRRALELAPRIDALIDQIGDTLQRQQAFNPAQSERRFVLSAPEFVTALIGGELVKSFAKLAPKASFIVDFVSPERALEALSRGEIDVALGRFGPLPNGFVSEVIYSDRYCVAARRGHPKLKGRITKSQYASTGHIFAHSDSEVAATERVTTPEVTFFAVVPRWLTVLLMVASSDAIATCPRKFAERHAERLGLQVLSPPFVPLTIEVTAVRRAGSEDPGADWLLERIRDAVAGESTSRK